MNITWWLCKVTFLLPTNVENLTKLSSKTKPYNNVRGFELLYDRHGKNTIRKSIQSYPDRQIEMC